MSLGRGEREREAVLHTAAHPAAISFFISSKLLFFTKTIVIILQGTDNC